MIQTNEGKKDINEEQFTWQSETFRRGGGVSISYAGKKKGLGYF